MWEPCSVGSRAASLEAGILYRRIGWLSDRINWHDGPKTGPTRVIELKVTRSRPALATLNVWRGKALQLDSEGALEHGWLGLDKSCDRHMRRNVEIVCRLCIRPKPGGKRTVGKRGPTIYRDLSLYRRTRKIT
jgi:hypothetical protein